MFKRTLLMLAVASMLTGAAAVMSSAPARADDCDRVNVQLGGGSGHRHDQGCREQVRYERQWVKQTYETRYVLLGYDSCGRAVYGKQRVQTRRGYYQWVPVRRWVCSPRPRLRFNVRFRL